MRGDDDTIQYGHYRIRRRPDGSLWLLGAGGMGLTYLAEDGHLRVDVALKVIHPARLGDSDVRRLFVREARAAARIVHPNVAPVLYLHDAPERMFYAMEFVDGVSLHQWLQRHGRPQPAHALALAEQIAAGLSAIHEQQLIHRDLKPANLMLVQFPTGHPRARSLTSSGGLLVKIIDFGLARAMQTTVDGRAETHLSAPTLGFRGTAAYASPEQCLEVTTLDGRSDLYSLGCILWEMLTGRPPFQGRNLREILNAQIAQAPPWEHLDTLPAEVVAPLRRLLAKRPEDRFPEAAAAAEALAAARLAAEGLSPAVVPVLTPPTAFATAHEAAASESYPGQRALRWVILGGALLLLASAGVGWWLQRPRPPGPGVMAAVEGPKAIAVLPFRNLSEAREGTFFAEGMQDDLLTRLAQIRELRVIARSSVQAFRSDGEAKLDLSEIARELGVTHLVEGSVRREAGRVVIAVALIEARTERQLWAGRFDRALADVFAVQDEIAGHIAGQIRARLASGERSAMAERPTEDLAAYDLYLRAKELLSGWQQSAEPRETLLQTARLLTEATERDPAFLLAFCRLAEVHDSLYWSNADRTPARLALAGAAVETAARLQPDRGEVRLARGLHLYWGLRDFPAARAELWQATELLPNSASAFQWLGLIERRRDQWDEAVRLMERSVELDPRGIFSVRNLHLTYRMQRRWDEAANVLDRARRAGLVSDTLVLDRAELELLRRGRLEAMLQLPGQTPRDVGAISTSVQRRMRVAFYQRNADEAAAALAESLEVELTDPNLFTFPREWFAGWIARLRGDTAAATAAFRAARAAAEAAQQRHSDAPKRIAVVALLAAVLGDRPAAERAIARAVELVPLSRDAVDGAEMLEMRARVAALAGDTATALETIESLLRRPGDLCYGSLLLDPVWDSLRDEPRFRAALAGQLR
ncbi:MAG: protein kinase [Verrucomicrobia bacterium]|nr:protein kinase [Verrucomicrobiota bacterium]